MPGNRIFNSWPQSGGGGGAGTNYIGWTGTIPNLFDNDYVGPIGDDGTAATSTATAGVMYLRPIFCPNTVADAICAQNSTTDAGATIYYGIYDTVSARDDRPNALLYSGSASGATASAKETSFTSATFTGRYWLALLVTGANLTMYTTGYANGTASAQGTVCPVETGFNTTYDNMYFTQGSLSSLPSTITWGSLTAGGSTPTFEAPTAFLRIDRGGL